MSKLFSNFVASLIAVLLLTEAEAELLAQEQLFVSGVIEAYLQEGQLSRCDPN